MDSRSLSSSSSSGVGAAVRKGLRLCNDEDDEEQDELLLEGEWPPRLPLQLIQPPNESVGNVFFSAFVSSELLAWWLRLARYRLPSCAGVACVLYGNHSPSDIFLSSLSLRFPLAFSPSRWPDINRSRGGTIFPTCGWAPN